MIKDIILDNCERDYELLSHNSFICRVLKIFIDDKVYCCSGVIHINYFDGMPFDFEKSDLINLLNSQYSTEEILSDLPFEFSFSWDFDNYYLDIGFKVLNLCEDVNMCCLENFNSNSLKKIKELLGGK